MENTLHEKVSQDILLKAYNHMMLAKAMADIYEENRNICKYVHSTSRGHEAIQLATAYQLKKEDWVSPYYRDESILLGIGFEPYQLMLQLLAKADDPFPEADPITPTLQAEMKINQRSFTRALLRECRLFPQQVLPRE